MSSATVKAGTLTAALIAVLLSASAPGAAPAGKQAVADPFSAKDRAYWAFQPLMTPAVPQVQHTDRVANPIDAFVLSALEAKGLAPAPRADKFTLVRRAYFDLLGLPPTPEQVDAFVNDTSPDAWGRLIDRLLQSPRYGERWARHWLDLVRYAESDGYKADDHRPHAWRYRDYVIAAFNADKPYDRFVQEQIAGDELFPDEPDAWTATGYMRLWPYEYNQRNVRGQWRDILNDVTDISGEVLLGLGMRCARCHNHKFDPILQQDYFRLRAFFAPVVPNEEMVAASFKQKTDYDAQMQKWLEATADVRAKIEAIEGPARRAVEKPAVDKFTDDLQTLFKSDPQDLSPLDRQIRHLAYRQLLVEHKTIPAKIKGEKKEQYEQLKKELAKFDDLKPAPLPAIDGVTDVGPVAPVNTIPGDDRDVQPGYLTILNPAPARIEPVEGNANTTGRRTTLAHWLTRPDNQFTTRTIVNRLWQHHFGRGICSNANDFGRQGDPPTHPQLLDWLARRFVADGWSLKAMHRLIMTSNTYQQASLVTPTTRAAQVDPANTLLWRMRVRRLAAEPLRDAMLAASGELDLKMGGPAVAEEAPRRTVYVKVIRNKPEEMLDTFDGPDMHNSCSRRNVTTTAPQALLLLNGDWTLGRAKALAGRLRRSDAGNDSLDARVKLAYRFTLGREPDKDELADALSFIDDQARVIAGRNKDAAPGGIDASARDAALVDFCHVLLNANEFIYVD